MTTPKRSTLNSALRLDTRKSAHSNSQSPASSAHRSINIVLSSMLPPRRSVMDVFKKPHEVEVRFDIVSNLPRELAILLFRCLPLPDLCRSAVVCRKWYHINQDRFLRKRRLQFVQAQKDEWLSEMENIPPPVTPQDNLTPCAKTTMVSAASPLGVIQYSSVISRRQSIPSPMSNLLHTPTHFPTLLENTAKLTITDEEKGDIRRCLFPFDRDPTPVANKHLTEKISKRSSKARLKRL